MVGERAGECRFEGVRLRVRVEREWERMEMRLGVESSQRGGGEDQAVRDGWKITSLNFF